MYIYDPMSGEPIGDDGDADTTRLGQEWGDEDMPNNSGPSYANTGYPAAIDPTDAGIVLPSLAGDGQIDTTVCETCVHRQQRVGGTYYCDKTLKPLEYSLTVCQPIKIKPI